MAGQHENYVGLKTLSLLPSQGNNVQVQSLTVNSPISTPCRRSTSSSTNVSMNTFISTNRDFDWTNFLIFLHQQAKFWAGYSRKFVP